MAYTGTHDNDTTLGWWREDTGKKEKANLQTYLQTIEHEGDVVWAMIRAAARSVANVCIVPMQDVLHLGSEARMNRAAQGGELDVAISVWVSCTRTLRSKLAALMEMTDRDGYEVPKEGVDAGEADGRASKRAKLGGKHLDW